MSLDSRAYRAYLGIVERHYPDVSLRGEPTIFEGNDHFVFVVAEEVAFRFPKVPSEIDPKRSRFLRKFSERSPLPVPQIELHRDSETSLAYEILTYLPGVPLSPSLTRTFSSGELAAIARQLGEFLRALHSFPIDEARSLGIDELDPTEFGSYMEQNQRAYPLFKRLVFPHVSQVEREWIETLFTRYIALVKTTPFPIRVIHSDMWSFHIIVDPQEHTLSGVIDFALRIADPANDFKAFELYGSDFVEAVYKHYALATDEYFDDRRLFYTGHDEVFELARQIERRNDEGIARHKRSLSAYIADHPLP